MNVEKPLPVGAEEPTRCAQCGRLARVTSPDGVCGRCMDEIYRGG